MKHFFTIFIVFMLFSCENTRTERNPYLQDFGFRFDLNLNLPLYSPLTNTGNAIFIGSQGVGTRGVFVINTGFNQFRAFEASCPNHVPNTCSTMELDGQNAICNCDDYSYSLFTGQLLSTTQTSNRTYNMLEYRAAFNNNVVVISN